MKIRLAYSKLAEAKYIAHLDLTRFFERALRRAGVEVARTEGFHPHAKISFGPPLAVGVEGLAEYVDVEIRDGRRSLSPAAQAAAAERAVKALQAEMPQNIRILTYGVLPPGAAALTASIDLACYLVWTPLWAPVAEADLRRGLADWLSREEIPVTRNKGGTARPVTKNIRPFVRRMALQSIAGEEAPDDPGFSLELEIAMTGAGSARAADVTESFCEFLALPWDKDGVVIVRAGLFTQGEKRLPPLGRIN
ncbi:MAG: TIGR03936 family radical SAM-associated protein [Gracilibacteraceae bacterium]|jgi:radical SAM-linked protein|nr:TIGR03936 family radical SAM-associated protein [Gracilibacteraceae bacterium]